MIQDNDTKVLDDVMTKVRHMVKKHESVAYDTTSLIEACDVLLLVRGLPERVSLQAAQPCTLGRADLNSSNQHVDLDPHGAQARGVSRCHASLQLIDNRIYLTDLNSTNGTYVADQRLKPNQPTELRKGQEFYLGQLGVQLLII